VILGSTNTIYWGKVTELVYYEVSWWDSLVGLYVLANKLPDIVVSTQQVVYVSLKENVDLLVLKDCRD
jgi:hypothetical protein